MESMKTHYGRLSLEKAVHTTCEFEVWNPRLKRMDKCGAPACGYAGAGPNRVLLCEEHLEYAAGLAGVRIQDAKKKKGR